MRSFESWSVIPCCVVLACLVLLAAVTSEAQEAQPTPPPLFSDAIDVELVNIDVIVTDKKGEAVTGLTREDFEILEDGKAVEISNFWAINDRRPVMLATGTAEVGVGVQELEPDAPLPVSQHLNMVVFIDDLELQPAGRKEALDALREFLGERMGGGQRIMLVRYNGSLEVITEMTSNPSEVIAGIEQVEEMMPASRVRFNEWVQLVRQLETDAWTPTDAQEAQMVDNMAWQQVVSYAQSVQHETRVKLKLLIDFVGSLAGLPGRKAIVLVSDGIAARPAESLFLAVYRGEGDQNMAAGKAMLEAKRFSSDRQIKLLTEQANANRVTFYTINSGGWSKQNLLHKSTTIFQSGQAGGRQGYGAPMLAQEMSDTTDINHSETLERLAVATGGQALRRASVEALHQVANDLDSYYSLGFVPTNMEDTEQRKIKVKVKQKGLKLRYRKDYRIRTYDERLASEAVAALMADTFEDDPIRARLEIGSDIKTEKGAFLVPVTVKILTDELAFLQDGDRWRAEVVLYMSAKDARGNIIQPVKATLPVSIPNDIYMGEAIPELTYDTALRVRKGEIKVAVSIYDEIGGVGGALASSLVIAEDGAVTVVDDG
jgi:VWFA-related protein